GTSAEGEVLAVVEEIARPCLRSQPFLVGGLHCRAIKKAPLGGRGGSVGPAGGAGDGAEVRPREERGRVGRAVAPPRVTGDMVWVDAMILNIKRQSRADLPQVGGAAGLGGVGADGREGRP